MSNSEEQTIYYRLADFPPGLVAIPTVDWMYTEPVIAFMNLLAALPPRSGLEFTRGSSAAQNRNRLTELFLANEDWKWILYCDGDQTPPPETVVRLLSHKVDIVSGLIVTRYPPYTPLFAAGGEFVPEGGLHEVAWLGGGCVLVSRRLVEAMPAPHWEHTEPGYGEDILFSQKAKALGFPLYVDCSLPVGHMAVRSLTVQDAAEYHSRPEVRDAIERGVARQEDDPITVRRSEVRGMELLDAMNTKLGSSPPAEDLADAEKSATFEARGSVTAGELEWLNESGTQARS